LTGIFFWVRPVLLKAFKGKKLEGIARAGFYRLLALPVCCQPAKRVKALRGAGDERQSG